MCKSLLSARCVTLGSAGSGSPALDALSAGNTIILHTFVCHVSTVTPPLFLPKEESNLQEESNVFAPSHPSIHSDPDLQCQPEALTLPAGRTQLPDGGSVIATPSAAAQCSRAVAVSCCLNWNKQTNVKSKSLSWCAILRNWKMLMGEKTTYIIMGPFSM